MSRKVGRTRICPYLIIRDHRLIIEIQRIYESLVPTLPCFDPCEFSLSFDRHFGSPGFSVRRTIEPRIRCRSLSVNGPSRKVHVFVSQQGRQLFEVRSDSVKTDVRSTYEWSETLFSVFDGSTLNSGEVPKECVDIFLLSKVIAKSLSCV